MRTERFRAQTAHPPTRPVGDPIAENQWQGEQVHADARVAAEALREDLQRHGVRHSELGDLMDDLAAGYELTLDDGFSLRVIPAG